MTKKRITFDFGIDLGTTNSAIAVIKSGTTVVLQNEQNESITPSCVHFDRRKGDRVFVGRRAKQAHKQFLSGTLKGRAEAQDTFLEFKRSMGQATTFETPGGKLTPEDLSAEVLRYLTALETDEEVNSCVVTVPAMFQMNQKDATIVAAGKANIRECRLLQEPIAAAMAYGVGAGDLTDSEAKWLVFDFGGGTFDAAIIGVSEGILSVIDTAGDNHLGGQDLDRAVVDKILLPHVRDKFSIKSFESNNARLNILKGLLKLYAEEARVAISFNDTFEVLSEIDEFPTDDKGEEICLDLVLKREEIEPVLIPIYDRAIKITESLLARKGLRADSLDRILLVGGPTQSPLLRKMLRDRFGDRVDTSVNPMTAVAIGAAQYASTIERELSGSGSVKGDAIVLELTYEKQTVEPSEIIRIKIPQGSASSDMVYSVELKRHDGGYSSGRLPIAPMGSLADVALLPNKANTFEIILTDSMGSRLACEPSQILITHGLKVGDSTLSYGIGIGVENVRKGYPVVKPIEGLEQGAKQPAKGRAKGLKTQKDIRPGSKEDIIKIPVYEYPEGSANTRLIHNTHIFDAIITGENFEALLPKGSEVELSLKVTDSKIDLSVYFPQADVTEEITNESKRREVVAEDLLASNIESLETRIDHLENSDEYETVVGLDEMRDSLLSIKEQFADGREDGDVREKILDQVRELAKKVDAAEDSVEWPTLEKKLNEYFEDLRNLVEAVADHPELNHEKVQKDFQSIERRLAEVIKSKDTVLGDDLLSDLIGLYLGIKKAVLGAQLEIGWINSFNDDFDSYSWTDRSRARSLVDQAVRMVASGAKHDAIIAIVREIVEYLPGRERPGQSDSELVSTN